MNKRMLAMGISIAMILSTSLIFAAEPISKGYIEGGTAVPFRKDITKIEGGEYDMRKQECCNSG